MQQSIQSFTPEQWLSTFQTAWIHASLSLLQGKSDSFPAFMRTPAWAYKDLNSVLVGGLNSGMTILCQWHNADLFSQQPACFTTCAGL